MSIYSDRDQYSLCKRICIEAHKGQKRRGGGDYAEHPLRVGERLCCLGEPDSLFLASVAFLHDVLEDTNMTYQDLYERGVNPRIVEYVRIMTKKGWETYLSYCSRVGGASRSIKLIKIADMIDNLLDRPTESQVEKYLLGFLEL